MQGLRPQILEGLPDHVYGKIRELEDSFVISTPGLKTVTNHIVWELEKGLTVEGGDIPMNVTWVMGFPTGEERGQYLTLDMGGTHLRVCDVILAGRNEHVQTSQAKFKIPGDLQNAEADDLWDYVAECLRLFLQDRHPCEEEPVKLPLAFTFSYPVTQNSIRDGILQQWTKSLNVPGVVGQNVVTQLQAAFERKGVHANVVALVNDTTGTLIASAYHDPEIKIGSIISTGCNAAYMEEYGAIQKIEGCELPNDALIAINTEYGAFDNRRHILPRTTYDENLDKQSSHPGCQIYEKMVAGLYLGELLRLVFLEMHFQGALFRDGDISVLKQPNVIDTCFLTVAEADVSESLEKIRELCLDKLGLEPYPCELKVCRYLVELIGTRAARLYACGIAAICKKRGIERCHVGVDGAVFSHYPSFKSRASEALREILDWPCGSEDLITFHEAQDGSGIGAALIAALAVKRGGGGRLKPQPEKSN